MLKGRKKGDKWEREKERVVLLALFNKIQYYKLL
jgi:hypothetical protein